MNGRLAIALFGLAALAAGLYLLLVAEPARAHPKRLPPAFVTGAQCIHGHEGSWDDPNGPYYGGLQMDWGFMSTYGTWLLENVGTADRWTPHQQLHVAYRAYRGWKGHAGRGWWPWPNTARRCGLL